ncbi:MAG: hypothetical protein ATN32_04060, partial [Candidatus Epulonipiscium fishelsonii]
MELLTPTTDFVFKKIFGDEQNKDLLLDFLNAVLKYKTPIIDLDYEDTILKQEYSTNKFSILDIKATLSNDIKVNVEIQIRDSDDMLKRSLYYWAKNYSADMKKGTFYEDLKSVVCINLLCYNLFNDENLHHKFTLYDKKLKQDYNEDLEIHFLEINKLSLQKSSTRNNSLFDWLNFIKSPHSDSTLKAISRNKKVFKAMEVLTVISGDKEMRELSWRRDMLIIEEASCLNKAKKQGRIEGLKKGRQ